MTIRTEAPTRSETGRREELLRLGIDLFSEKAYDELSIDDIAAAGGIAKGLLYYYFGSKRGYYVAVIEFAMAEQHARTRTAFDLPPEQWLRNAMEAHLTYVEEHAAGYRMLMDGGVGSDPEVKAIIARQKAESIADIAEMITGSRELSPLLRTALLGWISFNEGATLDWLATREITRDELMDLMEDAFSVVLAALGR